MCTLEEHAELMWDLCSSGGMVNKLTPSNDSVWMHLCHYQGKSWAQLQAAFTTSHTPGEDTQCHGAFCFLIWQKFPGDSSEVTSSNLHCQPLLWNVLVVMTFKIVFVKGLVSP